MFKPWFEVLVQVIGFFGTACLLISTQFNTHGKIMIFKTLGSFSFCLQYLLMGAFTGMILDAIGTIRNIVFGYNVRKGKSNKVWLIVFSILTVVLGVITLVFTWHELVDRVTWIAGDNANFAVAIAVFVSIISIIAKLLSTIAYAFKDAHKIRMLCFPTAGGWLVYNTVVFTLAGIINEALTIISLVIAEIRFKKPKKQVLPPLNNEKNDLD